MKLIIFLILVGAKIPIINGARQIEPPFNRVLLRELSASKKIKKKNLYEDLKDINKKIKNIVLDIEGDIQPIAALKSSDSEIKYDPIINEQLSSLSNVNGKIIEARIKIAAIITCNDQQKRLLRNSIDAFSQTSWLYSSLQSKKQSLKLNKP